jgi:signal transduction histidine kinase/KaiC/GvpD/RAD55 family RecA-like ATPase
MHPPNIPHDVFLSYNTRDRASVETIAHELRARGLAVFLDRWYLLAGRPWPVVLEEALGSCRAAAVLIGPSGMGDWQQREMHLAVSRQTQDPSFPVIPVLLPGADPALGFLSINTWIDLRNGVTEAFSLDTFAAAVQGRPPGAEELPHRTLHGICPFRGLRPFREEDAPFFCGREVVTRRLLLALAERSLMAVAGNSGSGKSSVVRAGLASAVRQGEEGRIWDIITLVPGDRPLHALAAGLVPLLDPDLSETQRLVETSELASHLAEGRFQLRDAVERILARQAGTDRLLLIVDQWEELYTLVPDERFIDRFIDEILVASEKSPLSVVVTLRGDFYGRAIAHRQLADRLEGSVINLGSMTREELRQAMENPAHKVGLAFEPGLVERILGELEREPGHLPLLEFVLTELWENRSGGRLLHSSYDQMGTLRGAIAHRADSVVQKLPHPEDDVRRLFLQLVRPGEGTGDTRRRAPLADVAAGTLDVVKALADARLVVTGRDSVTGEETIEIAHEALIHNWAQLRKWLDEDREFLFWRHRLRSALAEWKPGGQDDGVLLRGSRLIEAESWLAGRAGDLTPAERDFIAESAAQREREEQARRQQLYTIAEMQRKFALPLELAAIGAQEKLLSHFLDAVRIRLDADCAWIHSEPQTRLGRAIRGDGSLFDEQLAGSLLAGETLAFPPAAQRTTVLARFSVRGRLAVVGAVRRSADFVQKDRRTLYRLADVLRYEIERREKAKIANEVSRLKEMIVSELRPLDVIYHLLDSLYHLHVFNHSASLLSYDDITGRLRIEAEKIGFRKAKSANIGKEIPISSGQAARFGNGPVEIEGSCDGTDLPAYPHPRDDVLPLCVLSIPLTIAGTFRGLLRIALVERRPLEADRAVLEQFLPVASAALRNLKTNTIWERAAVEAERAQGMTSMTRAVAPEIFNALGACLPLVQQALSRIRQDVLERDVLERDLALAESKLLYTRQVIPSLLAAERSGTSDKRDVNVLQQIRDVLPLLQDTAARQGVEITADLPNALPNVQCSPRDFLAILRSLVRNSVEALASTAGRITISAAPEEDRFVTLTVTDDGPGIAEELLDKVVEPFFSTKPGNQGMGLAVCRALAWQHGGYFEIRSTPGQGTSATVGLRILKES